MSGRRSRKHAPAEPPVNVSLLFDDGDIVNVDCLYIGWHPTERVHVWEAISPRPTSTPRAIMVDKLPASTSIRVGAGHLGLVPDDRLIEDDDDE